MRSDVADFLVIVPTYRRPEFLTQALLSALEQPGVSKCIIVIDDCPDGSAQPVVAGIDPAVTYIKNPLPSGGWPAKVRNFGLQAAAQMGVEARFVHFLDDDDTVPHGHYKQVMRAFAAHPDAGVMFGMLRPFCEFAADPQRRARQEAQLLSTRQHFSRAARVAWIYHHVGVTLRLLSLRRWLYRSHAIFGSYLFLCSGAVVRYSVVAKLKGFNPQIRIAEDYDFFTRAIMANGAHFLERVSANYRLGNSEALWSALESSPEQDMSRQTEVRGYLTRRQLQLQSELGFLRFRARQVAFRLIEWVLNSVVIPVVDRLAAGEVRRASATQPLKA